MLSKLKKIWDKHGFEIVLISCSLFIVCFGLYYKSKNIKGSWSRYVYHIPTKKVVSNFQRESKGEIECRRVLQFLFNRPFNKARPDFLRNPVTGGEYNLELDCFDSELRIAVEYNGIQHYKYTPFFHKNKEAFLNQKYRDDMKRRICRENGILLIEVPYTTKIEDIKEYIEQTLKRNHIQF